jgi:hypothetical protein
MYKFGKYEKYLALAVIFAVLGFLLTEALFISWLNSLTDLEGFAFYEALILIFIYALSFIGLTIHNKKVTGIRQAVGLWLIVFAFFILVDWTSCGIGIVTQTGTWTNPTITSQSCTSIVPSIYTQSEDGVVWNFWAMIVNSTYLDRLLTYVITPFALVLVGGLLAKGRKPELK